jgi:hypothetical protein
MILTITATVEGDEASDSWDILHEVESEKSLVSFSISNGVGFLVFGLSLVSQNSLQRMEKWYLVEIYQAGFQACKNTSFSFLPLTLRAGLPSVSLPIRSVACGASHALLLAVSGDIFSCGFGGFVDLPRVLMAATGSSATPRSTTSRLRSL